MIAVQKDDYLFLNYDEDRPIESYVQVIGAGRASISASDLTKYTQHTFLFDQEAAVNFGRTEAGMDVTADGDQGLIYISSHFAAVIYGSDAQELGRVKLRSANNGFVTDGAVKGFVVIVDPGYSGTQKYGSYGLEALWRTGHRCGKLSRMLNCNPVGSLTLSDGTVIYSYPNTARPSYIRASRIAFKGNKVMYAGGDGAYRNYLNPLPTETSELIEATIGALLSRKQAYSIKEFSGDLLLTQVGNDDPTIDMAAKFRKQMSDLQHFKNSFDKSQFCVLKGLVDSDALNQPASLLSAVSPRDITGDNANLFRTGLMLESTLSTFLCTFDQTSIDLMIDHSAFDLVTIKDDFAGLLTKYKELKEKILKNSIVGSLNQMAMAAAAIGPAVAGMISERLQREGQEGGRFYNIVKTYFDKFCTAYGGWSHNSGFILKIPANIALRIIDSQGIFNIPDTSQSSSALIPALRAMCGIANPDAADDGTDLIFTPIDPAGSIYKEGSGDYYTARGFVARKIGSNLYEVSTYALPDTVSMTDGQELSLGDDTIKLDIAHGKFYLNGSSRDIRRSVRIGSVIDPNITEFVLEKVIQRFLKRLSDNFSDDVPGNMAGLLKSDEVVSAVNSRNGTVTKRFFFFIKKTATKFLEIGPRIRYIGCELKLIDDNHYCWEHYIEHRLINKYTNGAASAPEGQSVERDAIRSVLPGAIVSGTNAKAIFAGHCVMNNIGTGMVVAGGVMTAIFVAAGLAATVAPVGWIVAAALVVVGAILAIFGWCNSFKVERMPDPDLTSIRIPSTEMSNVFDLKDLVHADDQSARIAQRIIDAMTSAASDLAFCKIEPMLRTLKKSSVKEMLVLANDPESPTCIFTVRTGSIYFSIDRHEADLWKSALEDLIARDDDYKVTFELFVKALENLLDADASESKAKYYTERTLLTTAVEPSAEAFDAGYYYSTLEA